MRGVRGLLFVSLLFGDAILVFGFSVEEVCATNWAKPIPLTGSIITHDGVFQTHGRHPCTRGSSEPGCPLNDARLLLASDSTFLKVRTMQVVSAGARSIMGLSP